MSIWAGFGAQLPKSYENARRTRLDTLNAFNTFKKDNPYATGAEFQQFIDTAAGGSNYLRGGLPGKEIIDAIDKENKGNRDRRAMAQFVTEREQMGTVAGLMGAQLDQAVLGLKPDASETDYNNAFNSFLNTLPEGAGRDMYGKTAQPKFNQGYRGTLVTSQIRENLPDALTFMKNSVGSDVTAADLGKNFGLPDDVAKGLFTRTNELYSQEQNALKQSSYDSALALGVRLIGRTPDINPAQLTASIKEIYPNIVDQFAGDFFSKVATDALEQERIVKQDRLRDIERTARATALTIKGSMEQDSIIQDAVMQNDKAGWTQMYLDKMKENLSDEEIGFLYGVDTPDQLQASQFDGDWDKLVVQYRAKQRMRQQDTRTKAATTATTAAQQYIQNNTERADGAFRFSQQHGAGVESILSGMYDMNPSFARAAAEATNKLILDLGDKSDTLTPETIVQAIQGDPQIMGLTRSVTDAATAHGNRLLQTNGAFDVETADNYFSGFQEEFTSEFEKVESYVAEIMASSLDLEAKKTLLKQTQMEVNQFATSSMNNHIQRERRQDNWVEYGTGGYDSDRHDALGEEIEGLSVAIGGILGQAEAEIMDQIAAELADPTVTPQTSQVATPLFNETLAKVVESQGSLEGVNRAETALDAMNKLKKDLRSAAWQGRNDTNKDTWEQLTMVKTYLDYELIDGGFLGSDTTIQDKLSLDVNEYKKFIADPMAYMLADEEFLSQHPGYRELLGGVND